jgi:hypothetical protein
MARTGWVMLRDTKNEMAHPSSRLTIPAIVLMVVVALSRASV